MHAPPPPPVDHRYKIGIQMKQNELTKTFIIKKKLWSPWFLYPYTQIFLTLTSWVWRREITTVLLFSLHFIHKKADFPFIILLAVVLSSVIQCSAQTKNRWGHLSHYPGKKGDIWPLKCVIDAQCSAQTRNRWGHLSHYHGKKGDIWPPSA